MRREPELRGKGNLHNEGALILVGGPTGQPLVLTLGEIAHSSCRRSRELYQRERAIWWVTHSENHPTKAYVRCYLGTTHWCHQQRHLG